MKGEDYIRHFGVKGMKWGKRKATSDGDGVKKPSSREIYEARDRVILERNKVIRDANLKGKISISLLGEMSPHLPASYLKNPDRQIAFKMTKGEKVASAILVASTAGTGTVAIGAAVGLTALARRRTGENKK